MLSKLTDRFTETATADEIILMRIDNGEFFALEGTSAAAWRLIDGHRDRVALIAALAHEFSIEATEIATDVDEFLAKLRGSGLLADE